MGIDGDLAVSGNFRVTADVMNKYKNVLFIDASFMKEEFNPPPENSAIAVVNTIAGHFVSEFSKLIHAENNDEAEMLALLLALDQSKGHKGTTLIVSDSRHAVKSIVAPVLPHLTLIYHETSERYAALSERVDVVFAPRNSHAFQSRADYVAGLTRVRQPVWSYSAWLRSYAHLMSMPRNTKEGSKKVSFEGIKNMPKIKHRKSVLMRWAQEATQPATTPQEAAQ